MELCAKYDKEGQILIQNHCIKEGRAQEVEIAFKAAYDCGIKNIFAWAYKSCEYMSVLRSDRCDIAWSYFVKAIQDTADKKFIANKLLERVRKTLRE